MAMESSSENNEPSLAIESADSMAMESGSDTSEKKKAQPVVVESVVVELEKANMLSRYAEISSKRRILIVDD